MPTQSAVCPHCEAKLKVPETAAGKKIRCPKCNESFKVPADDEEPTAVAPKASALKAKRARQRADDDDEEVARRGRSAREDDDEDEEPARKRRPRKSAGNQRRVWWIVGSSVGLVLVAGGIVAGLLIFSGKSSAYKKREAISRQTIELFNTLCDVLDTVHDSQSAKAAAVKINEIHERGIELGKEEKRVSLSEEEQMELKKRDYPEMQKVKERMKNSIRDAIAKSEGEPDFMRAMTRFAEAGNSR
jgi:predicted Zn finger-like uncharacterized protein